MAGLKRPRNVLGPEDRDVKFVSFQEPGGKPEAPV